MRLLLVEDMDELATAVEIALADQGFAVDIAASIEEASTASDCAAYDVMLVDRRLPDGDGVNFVKSLRRQGNNTPTLIMTALADVEQRVQGLNAGADDYLPKPINFDELVARLRAVLRRPSTALDPVLEVGNLAFDTTSRQVWLQGREVRLPRRELGLLEVFMRRFGRVVARATLDDTLYSFNDEVSPNAIEVGVYRLRQHLAGAGANLAIRTVRGVGYVLEGGVEEDAAGAKDEVQARHAKKRLAKLDAQALIGA